MGSQSSPTTGLEYLLGLDGNIEVQNDAGYWVKMEVASVPVTAERPHGIRYSLTLHAPDNTRLIGFDNAHGVKPVGSRFKGDKSMNKVLKFGIAPVPVQRARTLAIAAGTRQRGKDEPNVWFPTVTAMARVLSDENMALLKVIRESHPDSMDALAKAVGKHAPNVSRSLHTMAQYGLVKLTKHGRTVIPQATSERVTVDFSWGG